MVDEVSVWRAFPFLPVLLEELHLRMELAAVCPPALSACFQWSIPCFQSFSVEQRLLLSAPTPGLHWHLLFLPGPDKFGL